METQKQEIEIRMKQLPAFKSMLDNYGFVERLLKNDKQFLRGRLELHNNDKPSFVLTGGDWEVKPRTRRQHIRE